MNREFLDLYNRELDLLYEHAREFADEYPGIAGRLGGLLRERMDPTVVGLLEGAAFLAARVQLKLKHEFPEFINNLLEQLVPHFLAPTPSMMLVKIAPLFGDPALREGRKLERGSILDAVYMEHDTRISCRYRHTAAISLWPFDLIGAEYYANSAPLQALGIPVGRDSPAGMRLSLDTRTAASPENEMSQAESRKAPDRWSSACRITRLPIYLVGAESDAAALYEQIFAYCNGIWFRYLDDFGNPVVVAAPTECVVQVGFDDREALIPNDNRIFRGFDLLREYFAFPRKFLAFDIVKLDSIMRKLPAKSIDIVFGFNEVNAHLAAAVHLNMFSLYTAPAINLFEMTTDRVPIRKNQHEFHVVPDRSRYLDFEPHRVLKVFAHVPAGVDKIPVRPLYSALVDAPKPSQLHYSIRRVPRRRTIEEKARGFASNYVGTDVFISLGEPATLDDSSSVTELSIRALCSNRHLTEHLPIGEGRSDFRFADDMSLRVFCVAGPTLPREPVVAQLRSRTEGAHTGVVAWRLLSLLRLNHLGLVERGAGKSARALREILATFADLADSAIERRLRGVLAVESRPVVRRLRRQGGIGPARGVEITLTLDDKAFEGSGAFLLGAVLDRFFLRIRRFQQFYAARRADERARRDHALATANRRREAVVTYFDELEREPWRFDFFDMMRRVERSLGTPLPARSISGNSRTAAPMREPRPRIGNSGSRREEVIQVRGRDLSVSFGQDPWMVFPASNIHALQWRPTKPADTTKRDIEAEFDSDEVAPAPDRIHIVVRFLGLLSAQGALPLATTEEAHGWLAESDPSFAHYLDVFNNRFLQLFYRAWADSRPIVQHDRVDYDRSESM